MKILLNMTVLQLKMLLRNRGLLIGSLGLAVVSMLVFGLVFGGYGDQTGTIGIADQDGSPASVQVVAGFRSAEALVVSEGAEVALLADLKKDRYDAVIVLLPGFGAGLFEGESSVRLYVNNADMIGAAFMRGTINGVFDEIGEQALGFKDPIAVEEQSIDVRRLRTIDYLTPGMLGLTIMFANMFVGIYLMAWRERGTLKRLGATPLRSWQLIGSQIISQLLLSFAQVAIIILIASTVFGVLFEFSWLPAIALMVLAGTFSIIALGYVVGNFVQKREGAQAVVTLISLPMMFLAGSYFPVNAPALMQPVIDALPLTQLNNALRQIMLNDGGLEAIWRNVAVLFATGAVLLALSLRTFRWSWGK